MLRRRRSLAQVQGRMGLFFTKDKPIEPYMGKFDQRSDFKLMHSTHRNSRTEQISGARRCGAAAAMAGASQTLWKSVRNDSYLD